MSTGKDLEVQTGVQRRSSDAGGVTFDEASLDLIMAVVVTYNPDDGLARRLGRLRAQVGVVVVDNGSAEQEQVRAIAEAEGCRFVGNATNLGIAAALNQAIAIARAAGAAWLATFDQDSLAPEGGLEALLQTYRLHPTPERIAMMAMIREDRRTGRDYTRAWYVVEETAEWRSVKMTITSGSLIRLSVIDRVGAFEESLFIDSVDHMFCLACRRAGMLIIESKAATLSHAMGRSTSKIISGRQYTVLNQNPIRNYYMTRNALRFIVECLRYDPLYAARTLLVQLNYTFIVLFFERQRRLKVKFMIEGLRDFLLGKYGPYSGHGAP